MGSGSVSPYPRRSTASGRCRPVAAMSSRACCQNSDELTLPCTNSTASPAPAGSMPSGCSTDWVNRLVATVVAAMPGSRTSGMEAPLAGTRPLQASDAAAVADSARAPPRLAGKPG